MKIRGLVVLLCWAAIAVGVNGQSGTAQELLEAARKTAVLDGDCASAIKQYQAIVTRFEKSDRAVAARALMLMAECHEKTGNAQEAQRTYEKIVRDFSDQTTTASAAKARLAQAPPSPRPSPAETERQVWLTASDDVWISSPVSADGRSVAFTHERDGGLFVRDLLMGRDRRVADAGRAYSAAFSRNGQRLAYQGSTGTVKDGTQAFQLWVTDLGTGTATPRRLIDAEAIPYDWTPDGKWIAVRMTRDPATQVIGLVSVEDGTFRELKSFEWYRRSARGLNGEPGIKRAAFNGFLSPDGSRLAVELLEANSGSRDITILPIDGGAEFVAVKFRGDDRLLGWLPDGDLLFASARSGAMAIWRQRFKTGLPQGEPDLIRNLSADDSLGITAGGALYTLARTSPATTVMEATFDFAAGTFTAAPENAAQTFVQSNSAPRWSPDGTRLGHISVRTGGNVFVMRTLATGQTVEIPVRFFFRGGNENLWEWIDDRSVVAIGEDARGRAGYHRIDLASGDISPLIEMPLENTGTPPFSPGLRGTIFYKGPVARDLVSGVERVAGPAQRYSSDGLKKYESRQGILVEHDQQTGTDRELIPVDSPFWWHLTNDGRTVIGASIDSATGAAVVLACALSDGSITEVFRNPNPSANAPGFRILAVGPDDRSVFVRSDRMGVAEYWWVPLDGRQAKPLQELRGLNLVMQQGRMAFEIHPDGRRIAFAVQGNGPSGSQVRALENFMPLPNGRGAGGLNAP
jgi:Tol biopolymer transport system component